METFWCFDTTATLVMSLLLLALVIYPMKLIKCNNCAGTNYIKHNHTLQKKKKKKKKTTTTKSDRTLYFILRRLYKATQAPWKEKIITAININLHQYTSINIHYIHTRFNYNSSLSSEWNLNRETGYCITVETSNMKPVDRDAVTLSAKVTWRSSGLGSRESLCGWVIKQQSVWWR